MTSVFQNDEGVSQGRLVRAADGFGVGSFYYELGHADRVTEDLELGAKIVLEQDTDWVFATQPFVQGEVRFIAPAVSTPGVRWRFTAGLVNDDATFTVFYTRFIEANGAETSCTFTVSTQKTTVPVTAGGTLRLTLELVAA